MDLVVVDLVCADRTEVRVHVCDVEERLTRLGRFGLEPALDLAFVVAVIDHEFAITLLNAKIPHIDLHVAKHAVLDAAADVDVCTE